MSHDDDENYTIPITPEEPDNSLSMGDEHLDTISATKSDEVIKSREFFNSNDDSTSVDENYFSMDNIDYVETSPPDSELIKSLNDNPTPDHVLKSPSPSPIPIEDSDSFLENSNTSLSYSDNSVPEFETFSNDICERKPRKEQNQIKTRQNGKRVEARKSLKQLQWVEEEKLNKTQKEWPKT
nr:hypothetical protein [Tanacetum cinerariifolium]